MKRTSKKKHRIQRAIGEILNRIFTRQVGSYGAFTVDKDGHFVDNWDLDAAVEVGETEIKTEED